MSDHLRDIGGDPVIPIADSRLGEASPEETPPQSLDKSPSLERKYGLDARSEPTHEGMEHLCRVWGEVIRAILLRRMGSQ